MAGATFTYHLPTTDTVRAGHWLMYGPPAPEMRYDSYPAFEAVPDSRGEAEPVRHGAFIAELDAVDDVMEAVREALKIIAHFEAVYGIAPEQWRLYLSGKRSVHLILPAEVLGTEEGHKLLPLIYKRQALDLAGNAGLKTLDLAMYKMGTGQPFRLPNRQRENGRYKVPLTFDELCEIADSEDYAELCSAPRPEPSRVAPARSEVLAEKIAAFTADAEEAARVKPEPLDDETAEKLKKAMPVCIAAISRAVKKPKSGKTFNEVSMQLIAYAVTAGLSEAQTLELFEFAIRNYPFSKGTPYAERLQQFKSRYRFMAAHDKGFSCAGVLALGFAEFDCAICNINKDTSAPEAETGAPFRGLRPASDIELYDRPEVEHPALLATLIFLARLHILSAFMKSGKTEFILQMIYALLRGEDFIGLPTKKSRVLLITEMAETDVLKTFRKLGHTPEGSLFIHGREAGPFTLDKVGMAQLASFVKENHIDLVVVDVISRFWTVPDENSATEVEKALLPLLQLCGSTGAAILLAHHETKAGGEHGRGIRGSGGIFGTVDQALMLGRHGTSKTQRVLKTLGRFPESPEELLLDYVNGQYVAIGSMEEAGGLDFLVRETLGDEPMTISAISTATGLHRPQVYKALHNLEAAGEVLKQPRHGTGGGHVYTLC